MFETAVVRDRVAGRRRFGLLSVSLAAHSLLVLGVVAAGISSLSFPPNAPRELPLFNPIPVVSLPAPLGSPAARRSTPPQSPPAAAPGTAVAPPPETAPANVPDSATPVHAGAPAAASSVPGTGTGELPYGSPAGDPNVVDIGQGGGSGLAPAPDVVHVPGGEVKPATVLRRVEPRYPQVALLARMSGVVVLRCVIGKDGQIRDPEVISSSFGAFTTPALDALRQWRFAPGSFRGRPVDTWFELTIRFSPR